jgi:hypothetical protein
MTQVPASAGGPRLNRVGVAGPVRSAEANRDSHLLALTFHPECFGTSVRGAAIGMAVVGLVTTLLSIPLGPEQSKKTQRETVLWMAATGVIVMAVGLFEACDATHEITNLDSLHDFRDSMGRDSSVGETTRRDDFLSVYRLHAGLRPVRWIPAP